MKPQPARLKDVAREAGLSLSAVSYALRGAPNIPPETAERVREVADRLGYRQQPRVAELMAHIRRSRSMPTGEQIAFVWMDAAWKTRPFVTMWEGAQDRARALGYDVDEFWRLQPGMTDQRLGKILHTRGIRGVLLSPLIAGDRFSLAWDWSPFCVAVLGNAASEPELHRVGHHHFAGMTEALKQFIQAGHRRIAALLDRTVDERAKRAWSGAFLAHHPLPSAARKLLHLGDAKRKSLDPWWQSQEPDALITTSFFLKSLPARAKGVRIVLLDHPADHTMRSFAGIDQQESQLASHAVDFLVARLQFNDLGVPAIPTRILLTGRWQDEFT